MITSARRRGRPPRRTILIAGADSGLGTSRFGVDRQAAVTSLVAVLAQCVAAVGLALRQLPLRAVARIA